MQVIVYDIMPDMVRPRTPPPEAFRRNQSQSLRQVTFRLDAPEHDALLQLAGRAGIGHSTLARRIVENYLSEHAPRSRRRRS